MNVGPAPLSYLAPWNSIAPDRRSSPPKSRPRLSRDRPTPPRGVGNAHCVRKKATLTTELQVVTEVTGAAPRLIKSRVLTTGLLLAPRQGISTIQGVATVGILAHVLTADSTRSHSELLPGTRLTTSHGLRLGNALLMLPGVRGRRLGLAIILRKKIKVDVRNVVGVLAQMLAAEIVRIQKI
jgi:hypothetical protein